MVSEAGTAFLSSTTWKIAYASLKLPSWTPHPGSSTMRRACPSCRTHQGCARVERRRHDDDRRAGPRHASGLGCRRLRRNAPAHLLPSEERGALWSRCQDGRHPDQRRRCRCREPAGGFDLGHAYQFLDDVADVVAGVDEVGKERGKDAGKCTAIDLFGVEGARRKASEFQARSL